MQSWKSRQRLHGVALELRAVVVFWFVVVEHLQEQEYAMAARTGILELWNRHDKQDVDTMGE